jgi:hypothetical protein
MPPRIRLPLALCALLVPVGLTVFGASASASPRATAARTLSCKSGSTTTLAGGYYLNLRATGTPCTSARAVQGGYQACRLKSGQKGKCHAKVAGYTCHEGKRNSIAVTFFAAVNCTNGAKKISWSYEQDVTS